MAKFKVGDKVIANKQANDIYSITRKGWVGAVVAVAGDKNPSRSGISPVTTIPMGYISVIEPKYAAEKPLKTGRTFVVKEECFDLAPSFSKKKKSKEEEKAEVMERIAKKAHDDFFTPTYSIVINRKKRTIKIAVFDEVLNKNVTVAVAKCHEDDGWNRDWGIKLAITRFYDEIEKARERIENKNKINVGDTVRITDWSKATLDVHVPEGSEWLHLPKVGDKSTFTVREVFTRYDGKRNGTRFFVTLERVCVSLSSIIYAIMTITLPRECVQIVNKAQ